MAGTTSHIVIIGSGMGGATVAAALASTGVRITILERGEALIDTVETRDDAAIFSKGFFRPDENWIDGNGQPFNPGNFYVVGGNSKFYGAVLTRYREEDFSPLEHIGGMSPGWPISYNEFEPWYQQAEEMFSVCGDARQDPTEPTHSGEYPFHPVADEPSVADLRVRLEQAGVTPSSLPLGIDIDAWLARAAIPFDGFPGLGEGKKDAQSVSLAQALAHENVTLVTDAKVERLEADETGRIVSIFYKQDGAYHTLKPDLTVLSAGAVNSAALLLSSANDHFPNGLANRSDQVGRNFMNHNCSAVLAVHPFRVNDAIYQKTLQFNDFYLTGGPEGKPLGNMQLLGKISGSILQSQSRLPGFAAQWLARRSVDFYAMSEDLPSAESRVEVKDGQIHLNWQRSNWRAHEGLVAELRSVLKRAGFPLVLSKPFDRRTPSHQCGTARFGVDPEQSVLDVYCRAHDHNNLYVVDASFLPNSAAVNPALTIAAQALRVGNYIREKG